MTYSKKDFNRILKNNGYRLVPERGKGSHTVYRNTNNRILTLSNSGNKMIYQRLIKEYNLVV